MRPRCFPFAHFALALLSFACASASGREAAPPAEKESPVLIGTTSREAVEMFSPDWVEAEVTSQPEAAGIQALASIEPGAEVEVFLGTWCGDSRREIPRLWKALDQLGSTPFGLSYVAVDRGKKEPAAPIAEGGVLYLPTLIVKRNGHEVGRIVETSPHGVEADLADLLSGKASGLLTTRTDLGPASPANPGH
jgi:thiol-disulfide isomerase/thioredoxin